MLLQNVSQKIVGRSAAKSAAPVVEAKAQPQNEPPSFSDIVQTGPSDVPEKLAKLAAAAAIPAAVGVYAGLAKGPLAGVAGAVAATPILVLGGTLAGAFVTEKLMHQSDGDQLGGVFLGGAAGALTGAVGGYLLSSSTSSPALAAGLGLAGALSGALVAVLRS